MHTRNLSLLLLISLLISPAQITTAWAATDSYNSRLTYQGKYTPDDLYVRIRNNPNWYHGINGTYPKGVLCKDALNNLATKGRWRGNLHADGSCGSIAEPAEWAVGNRLNYESSSGAAR